MTITTVTVFDATRANIGHLPAGHVNDPAGTLHGGTPPDEYTEEYRNG